MIGEIVDTYRIVSRLGAGGMGAVWLAEHTLLGRRVAIKFLLPEVSKNQTIVDRFFAEARAATRIADPGIVVVYDFGWHTTGAAYIVMEHLAGESVQARLRHGRLAVVDAVRIVQHAAIAMAVAHGAGIIHRDLKPDNVFLVPDPVVPGGERVKILDFGIAKLLGDEQGNPSRTHTGMIMGTPTYMSPEQCRGAPEVDHRTDIYALGCVLFHLLTGRLPFVATNSADMIAAHLIETPPPPSTLVPQIPASIDAIVMRCLAKQANDRYPSMVDLARALGAAVGTFGEISSIPPLRANQPATRPSTPSPMLAPAQTAPPPVAAGAHTVATFGGSAATYSSSPPSTFSSGLGESIPPAPRRARWLPALLAVAALGAIGVTIAVATSRSHGTGPAEPAQPGPSDAAVDVPRSLDAAPIDAAPADAGRPDAPPDARRPIRPPLDAARPRPLQRGSDDDPYANP